MESFYQNPIIHADYADPDVIRTGDDFWMVASSFNQVPGLPLLHSRDLVHWKLVNYIVKHLPSPEYDSPRPGKGIWAPSIRFHDNQFWVFYSLPDEGIYVVHSSEPLGEWSEPRCLKVAPGWIDPCPFWDDDGKAWLVHAFAFSRCGIKNKLQLIEMAPDVSHLKNNGVIIFDGTMSHPTLEGPKIYKRNGEYWIFAPAGGVKRGWQSVFRSKCLTGPWQHRDVLHQGDTAINGPHQGAWVELSNGQSWFFHFQDKGVYGRIVHLQPLFWSEDGWPIIGEKLDGQGKGQPVQSHPFPDLPFFPCDLEGSDHFQDGVPSLQWQWQANPRSSWLVPIREGLQLRSMTVSDDVSIYHLPHLLLQKFPAERFYVISKVDLSLCVDGDEGGLVIYGQRFAALCVRIHSNRKLLSFRHGWINDNGLLDETLMTVEDISNHNHIELGFRVGYDGLVNFRWRIDNEKWHEIEPQFSAGAGKWIGARMGLYARGKKHIGQGAFLYSSFEIKKA